MAKFKEEINYSDYYNRDVQVVLLNSLISDPEGFARLQGIVSDTYFHDTLRPAVRFVLDYANEFRSIPSIELIAAKSGVDVQKSSESSPQQTEWLLKEMEGFCRYKAIEGAILESASLLQSGEGGEIERRIKEAMTVGLMSDLGTDYFEDPKARLERMRDHSSYISTGWSELDRKLYGGFSRGALNIFCGGSGSGKSLFLQNLALNWAFAGINVLYISLELSEDLIALRLDAMVTTVGTSSIFSKIDAIADTVTTKGLQSGRLTIKKLPEGGTCCNDLRAFLKEYEIKTGVKPDAILIDYLDLMSPNNKRIDPSDAFTKDKHTSEEMRALAHEFNVLMATASQLNRGSIEAMGEFDQSHIAGGISKINTADNVFALFTTNAMKEKGRYDLMFLKTRSAAAVGQRIELGYDPVCMRIVDAVVMDDPNRVSSMEDMRKKLKNNVQQVIAEPVEEPERFDILSRLKKQKEQSDL